LHKKSSPQQGQIPILLERGEEKGNESPKKKGRGRKLTIRGNPCLHKKEGNGEERSGRSKGPPPGPTKTSREKSSGERETGSLVASSEGGKGDGAHHV